MLRPFFSFYGGKWRDTPRNYPAPNHGRIVEPFAGSAGYACRYHDHQVVLIDKDPTIAGLWRYLIRATSADIMAIPLLAEGQTVADLEVCSDARALVGFWVNRGASAPRNSQSSWMRSGIRPGSFWGERVRARIAGQVGAISHWAVSQGDYVRAGDTEATWFIDPPYEVAGKHYRYGSDAIDYAHLATWCRSRQGQVIVCENERAEWLPFEPIGSVKTSRKGSRSAEAVWLGGLC